MFYSNDLLGRKTPLGAIWTMAHGKKLTKGRILGINVADICQQILQPDVPHSLRLQGILIGGLVILFNKQQNYLLEDLQELVKRVKTATAAPPVDAGGVRGKAVLPKAKDRARLDAITMLNMDDVMAAANMDLSQLLQAGDYGDMPLADGMFVMPSLAEDALTTSGTTVALSDPAQQAQRLLSQMQQQHGLAALGGNAFGQEDDMAWELHNETFDVPPDFNLLGDEQPASATTDNQQQQPQPLPHQQAPTPAPSNPLRQAEQMLTGPADEQEEMLVVDDPGPFEMDWEQVQQQGQQGRQGSKTGSESTALEAAHVPASPGDARAEAAAAGQQAAKSKKRGSTKRKAGTTALIDDLQHLQITSRQYREWVQDQSELLALRPLKAREGGDAAISSSSRGGRGRAVLPGVAALLAGAPAAGDDGWCDELKGIFRGFVLGDAGAEGPNPRRTKQQRQHKQEEAPLAGTGELLMTDDVAPMEDMEPLMMMEDDQLMGLPFGGDIELERLRHGLTTPASTDLDLRLSPNASAEAAAQQLLGGVTTGRRSRRTNASSESLRAESEQSMGVEGRARRGRGSGFGDLAGLMEEDEPMYFGNGNLEDLLPPLDEEGGPLDLLGGPNAAAGGAGAVHGSDGSGWANRLGGHSYDVPTSQFPLLEESAPDATQPAPPDASVNRQTVLVINAFRARLSQAKAAQGAGDASISFFDMVQQLSRGEAAKLFYQVCVTTSTGYFKAEQEQAFGDIKIKEGPKTFG